MHIAVSGGYMKKTVEDILKQMAIGLSFTTQSGELTRIGFIASDILLGEIVEPRNMRRLFLRHGEYILKGADFVLCDDPVGLGHLG